MATFDVELPNGKVIQGIPEGTSKTAIMRKAVEAGLASYADFGEKIDATSGEFTEDALAGAGKAFTDMWRGIKQTLNIGDQEALEQEISRSRELDQDLMNSGAGITGNVLGNLAMAVPAAAAPGANTVLGSAALGGLYAGLMPTTEDESAVENALGGAVLGGATQAAIRGAPAVFRAITRPFHEKGRERIAAETLKRFATGNIDDVAQSRVPGVKYSLAEATQDPGIATLERGARNLDPTIAGPMGAREMENISAVRSALGGMAGDDATMAAAKAARTAGARSYDDVLSAAVLEPDEALTRLLQRPSAQRAMERASQLADEAGIPEPTAAQWLHYTKMAMDDMLDPKAASGLAGNEARAVRETRNALTGWMNDKIPGYSDVRTAYAEASRPINQMQVGRYLEDKLNPALNDFVASPRTRAETYARALRGADDTVRKATDFGGATMRNTMTPEQMDTLEGIGEYFARRAGAQDLGRAAGTNTAQNLSTGNLMRQIAGPLGIPESWTESALARTIMQPASILMRPAEDATQQTLVRALMDPEFAKQVLANATPGTRQKLLAAILDRAVPAAAIGSGASAIAQ